MTDVASNDPVADIIGWAATRPLWQQDALRRLALTGRLTDQDKVELIACIRTENGLPANTEAPALIPLAVGHLNTGGTPGGTDTRLLSIREMKHVGRMAAEAHLEFGPSGATSVYGDNGAGKSGYTRVLRRAGSGRGDDLKKKIWPDVFENAPASDATAIIDIERGGAKEEFRWSAAAPDRRIPGLAVFDSDATQAYVDAGNAIELLPFNIDIIQGLIEFCDSVKALFTAEARQASDRLDRTRPQIADGTQAAAFVATISAKIAAQEIADKVTLSAERRARLVALRRNVLTPQERLRTVTVLAPLLDTAAPTVATAEAALADEQLEVIRNTYFEAKRKAQVAKDLNSHLLEGHDLPVGSELWRTMWEAARDYAQGEVHPSHTFPDIGDDVRCPLCQQILGDEARGRFVRLEDYVSAKVQRDAEDAANTARMRLGELDAALKAATEATAKLDIAQEDPPLAADVAAWGAVASARRSSLAAWLEGQGDLAPAPAAVAMRLLTAAANARTTIGALTAGTGTPEALAEAAELKELEAWEALEAGKAALELRVRDLATRDGLQACVDGANTTTITRFFNSMKDRYLTSALLEAYEREIGKLKLGRLKVKVTPKKDREAARFSVDLDGRKITSCKLSEILSEGERRALSLAAFLAEQSIGGGAGCLVFDDPVSSLDHGWAQVIADRLAEEALRRQVIVFTHDLVFYDKFCTAVETAGAPLEFQQLFRARAAGTAGHVDSVKGKWSSQKVKGRINELKALVAKAAKTADESAGQYERDAKEIYGRMRDAWERLVEELLFKGVVQRFQKDIKTRELRYLTAESSILARIDAGMTRCSTYSHDNPLANTDPIPEPNEMAADLQELEAIADWLNQHHKTVK